jgi:hypothetical protein
VRFEEHRNTLGVSRVLDWYAGSMAYFGKEEYYMKKAYRLKEEILLSTLRSGRLDTIVGLSRRVHHEFPPSARRGTDGRHGAKHNAKE